MSKDHTSIRVHAPPGGQSSNIFGTSEFEQSAANKKKHTESDIFGNKADALEAAQIKQAQQAGNNIFGNEPEQPTVKSHMHGDKNKSTIFNETPAHDDHHGKSNTVAGLFKQTQMKSSIFDTDEPSGTRFISDKNKSNVFATNDHDDPNKRAGAGGRHGLRVGYNPINGEAYSKKVEPTDASHPETSTTSTENIHPAGTTEKAAGTSNQATNAQQNVHTSVRVFHPPGGRSNGPLW